MFDACRIEKFQTWAIVMEYLPWPDIEDRAADFPPDAIWTVIEQLAAAAKWLEDQRLVRRDIKPSNILISPDYSKIKLLDFGVMRRSDTFEGSGTPTEGEYRFVATRRYSSPRYLFGHPTPDLSAAAASSEIVHDWRALTFYQIGGVLHDLIMGVPLFDDYLKRYGGNPHTALEQAVMTEIPVIENPRVDPRLIDLARDCLDKEDARRLQQVHWDRFVRTAPVVSKAMLSVRNLLRSPTSAEWDALQMAMRTVLQEVLDIARDVLAQQPGEAIRTRVYPIEPLSDHTLASAAAHKWQGEAGAERVLSHIFEVGASSESTAVIVRYGAALGYAWSTKLADIQLVSIGIVDGSGSAASSCDLGSEIQRIVTGTLMAAGSALKRLDSLQQQTAYVDIRRT
jgi:serine/threonine protein kinase